MKHNRIYILFAFVTIAIITTWFYITQNIEVYTISKFKHGQIDTVNTYEFIPLHTRKEIYGTDTFYYLYNGKRKLVLSLNKDSLYKYIIIKE